MKNKGFTLVELLAVIAILSIVLIIAVPIIGNIVEDSRKKTFKTNEEMIKKAANVYVGQGNVELPHQINEEIDITYAELKQKNYIKKIKDPKSHQECDGYLKIKKISDNNYVYVPNIVCENYTSEKGVINFFEESDLLVEATKNYISDKNIQIPNSNYIKIKYTDLKNESYIEQLKDPKTDTEAYSSSLVKVVNNNGTYEYYSGLVTENYIRIEAHNYIKNNNFVNGINDWSANKSTILVDNQVLKDTGNGSNKYPSIYQKTLLNPTPNHKIFIYSKVKFTTTGSTWLDIALESSGGAWEEPSQLSVNEPAAETWHELKTIYKLTNSFSTDLTIWIQHCYNTNAASNNKVLEVDGTNPRGVLLLDLSEIYGVSTEPSLEEFETILTNSGY